MVRREFVLRKLQLIADDLERLVQFKDETLASLTGDYVKLAAVERLLERIVMRAIDINEHLISELGTGEGKSTRLTYRDTFLLLAALGVYPQEFAEQIARSAGLRNILVHDYNDADRKIVHGSIKSCLQDYHQYVELYGVFLIDRPVKRAWTCFSPGRGGAKDRAGWLARKRLAAPRGGQRSVRCGTEARRYRSEGRGENRRSRDSLGKMTGDAMGGVCAVGEPVGL